MKTHFQIIFLTFYFTILTFQTLLALFSRTRCNFSNLGLGHSRFMFQTFTLIFRSFSSSSYIRANAGTRLLWGRNYFNISTSFEGNIFTRAMYIWVLVTRFPCSAQLIRARITGSVTMSKQLDTICWCLLYLIY